MSRKAAGVNVVITGDKALDRKLHQLPFKIQNRIARDELKKITKKLVIAAQNNLEVSGNVDTGKLLRGIKTGAMKRSRSRIGRIVKTTARSDESQFGGFQLEFGTKTREAESFLRKAGYENEQAIRSQMIDGIEAHFKSIETAF
jgi:HK97 gp10 family phage protein